MVLFTKNRLTAWVVIILIVLNIVAVGTLWWTQIRWPPFGPPPQQPDVLGFLARELKLNAEQVEQFHTFRELHFQEIRLIEQEIHQYRRVITEAVFDEDVTPQQLKTWAEKAGQKQAELELKRFQHFKDMKSLCTPVQKRRFEVLLKDVLDMSRPPGAPPPADRNQRPPHGQPPPGRHEQPDSF